MDDDHWKYFNWLEIKREAALRLQQAKENKRPSRELSFEYWCAWCAHANVADCLKYKHE